MESHRTERFPCSQNLPPAHPESLVYNKKGSGQTPSDWNQVDFNAPVGEFFPFSKQTLRSVRFFDPVEVENKTRYLIQAGFPIFSVNFNTMSNCLGLLKFRFLSLSSFAIQKRYICPGVKPNSAPVRFWRR